MDGELGLGQVVYQSYYFIQISKMKEMTTFVEKKKNDAVYC